MRQQLLKLRWLWREWLWLLLRLLLPLLQLSNRPWLQLCCS